MRLNSKFKRPTLFGQFLAAEAVDELDGRTTSAKTASL
jgi:hypothetical protein